MAEPALSSRRSRWPFVLGGILLFLVLLYFVVGSGPFLRKVVVPMVASQLHSELTVDDISFSPFSSLRLRGVKIVPEGSEPLATVSELKVKYGLWSILTGTIQVSEFTVDSPAITIVQHGGAPSNLEVFAQRLTSGSNSSSGAAKSPPHLDIRNVVVRNGEVALSSAQTNGTISETRISGFEFSLDSLANGGTGKIKLASNISLTNGASGQLSASGHGEFDLSLSTDLQPTAAKGSFEVSVNSATGNFKSVQGLAAILALDETATDLRELALSFKKGTAPLGQVSLAGQLDLQKKEARIAYKISGIKREVTSLLGGLLGIDLGDTNVSGSGRIDWAQLGNLVASNGRFDVARFTVGMPTGVTPPVDLGLDYKVSINLSESTALMEKMTLTAVQDGRPFLKGDFNRPMNIAWKNKGPGFGEATYSLSVDGFDLAPWQPLLANAVQGIKIKSGRLKFDTKVISREDGHSLKLELSSEIAQLGLIMPDFQFDNANIKATLAAGWEEFATFRVERFTLDSSLGGNRVASLNGVAHYQNSNKEVGFQVGAVIDLPRILSVYPVDGVDLQTGESTLSIQVTQKSESTEGSINVALAKLKGRVRDIVLSNYQARVDCALKLAKTSLTITRIAVSLQNGFESGGTFDVNGTYDTASKAGQFSFKSINLNQVGLGPLVASAMAPNRLVSVGLNMSGHAEVDPIKGSSLQAEVQAAKLQLEDPGHVLPDKPVSLGVALDVSQRGAVTDIKKFNLLLGPTPRVKNELAMTGHFDFAKENPTASFLTGRSDGLDFTALYALFAQSSASSNAAPVTKKAESRAAAGGGAEVEPAAVAMPLQKLDVDLSFAHVYLGEIAIADWVAKAKLDHGVVTIDPFGLSFNGAPVNAKALLDLSVPGYKYNVSMDANRAPLAPAVNTFQPSMAGYLGGTAIAAVSLKGAGVTGPSLQRNLEGQFDLSATNLNLKISNVQGKFLKGILNVVVGLPDLIRNPTAALTKLGQFSGLTPASTEAGKSDGWVDQLQAEPLQGLGLRGKIGAGTVNVTEASVQSAVLRVRAPGTITLAPVLTNSPLDFAVDVGLKESLGKKIGLSAAGGEFASLPAGCLAIRGTLGNPEPKPDTAKLLLLGGKAILGVAGNTGAALGDLIGQVAAGGTNAPSTNSIGSALKSLGGLFGGGAAPNASGATNPPSSQPKPKK